ncbi:hypothetical protein C8_394 [Cannes 8 virus]|uniref:Uncharacterized protein n=1 Tax=Marseillevirus marseillevirus TaxID=694581 RepID=D2XB12_GBMV|nr:hypothetical protein MAR_ORF375 [Marseillevirus marseillevirus]YP_009094836.1 hypothetical protein MEL_335 [Melbournevirus]ADB04139.1 hypothetical protein MAR_ORF375 [Marseillevirus marseillevirus]AGV01743.1 hypothetical protein C8_394 [Cannes 8 virus]AIT54948.1 hypothetical protein MEL_335 [Melbournevirus]
MREFCTHSPLPLSQLSAFVVVENDAEWKSKNIDCLSLEALESAERGGQLFSHFLRGRTEEYLLGFGRFIDALLVMYPEDFKKEDTETALVNLLGGMPTVDLVSKYSRKTKDAIFELVLFWEKLPIEYFPESLFVALCKE